MTDAGVPDEDAYNLLLTLRSAKKTDTETEAQQERRMLQQADISGEGKSTVYYGLMATDKERELMDAMADTGADMGAVTQMLMEVKDAGDLTGADASNAKRLALTNSALTDTEKQEAYRYLFGTKQDDGTYASSRDDDIAAFEQAGLDMGHLPAGAEPVHHHQRRVRQRRRKGHGVLQMGEQRGPSHRSKRQW